MNDILKPLLGTYIRYSDLIIIRFTVTNFSEFCLKYFHSVYIIIIARLLMLDQHKKITDLNSMKLNHSYLLTNKCYIIT